MAKKSVKKKAVSKKKSSKRKISVKKKTVKKAVKKKTTSRKVAKKKTAKKTTSKKKTTKKKSSSKSSKIERIPTGIKNFDKLIEGGFESNSTNIIVGSSGSGKSIFALQFLIGGLKKGEKCLYVTFEEKKEQVYKHMAQFGWDLNDYEKKGKFIFLEYTPGKVKTMLEEGGGAIETILLTKNISRMVIDSITSFELLFEKELEKREAALSLFNMIAKWNCTSLLTLEGKPSQKNRVASRTIEFESDGIILLYYPRSLRKRERYLEVLKMRGTNHSKNIHKLTIDKSGINVGLGSSSMKV